MNKDSNQFNTENTEGTEKKNEEYHERWDEACPISVRSPQLSANSVFSVLKVFTASSNLPAAY